jgi:hypothetical protein
VEEKMKAKSLLLTLFVVAFCSSAVIAQIDYDENMGIFFNFDETDLSWSAIECTGQAIFDLVDNPAGTGGLVGKVTTTACTDEGLQCDQEFKPIDFSIRYLIRVDVYAPAAGRKVVLRVEDFNDSNKSHQVEMETTTSGAWETLAFDFTGAENGVYSKIIILPDFGGETAGDVWYFDTVRMARPAVTYDDGWLVDFENHVNYMFFWDCGSPAEADFEIVDNPDPTGINTSEKVGFFITSNCVYEGVATGEIFQLFDFSQRWIFKVKVYAPEAGRTFMFKIEKFEDNTNQPIEKNATTTVAYQWEELEFDFTGAQSNFYGRIALFPDFQSDLTRDEWYFDDVRFVNPTEVTDRKPARYDLRLSNYPNPFNPSTTIDYTLQHQTHVKLTIHDILGREIETLVDQHQMDGRYKYNFDATGLPSGVYLYRLKTDNQTLTHKALLLK